MVGSVRYKRRVRTAVSCGASQALGINGSPKKRAQHCLQTPAPSSSPQAKTKELNDLPYHRLPWLWWRPQYLEPSEGGAMQRAPVVPTIPSHRSAVVIAYTQEGCKPLSISFRRMRGATPGIREVPCNAVVHHAHGNKYWHNPQLLTHHDLWAALFFAVRGVRCALLIYDAEGRRRERVLLVSIFDQSAHCIRWDLLV